MQESLSRRANGWWPQSPQMAVINMGRDMGLQRGGGKREGLPGLVPATFVMHNCLAFAGRSAELSSACEAFPQKVISGLCTRLGFVGLPADPTFLLDFQLAGQPRVGVNLIYAWEREMHSCFFLGSSSNCRKPNWE